MKKEYRDQFYQIFDGTLVQDGFVRRYQAYWKIDFAENWYICLWPKSDTQGYVFDVQLDIGCVSELDADECRNMHRSRSRKTLRRLDRDAHGPVFKLWSMPDYFPHALEVYKKYVSQLFRSINSLYDIYLLDRKLSSDMVTLSDERYIDMLLFLGKYTEAQQVANEMRKWIDFLNKKLSTDEQSIRSKLAEYYALPESIKKIVAHIIKSWESSIDNLPRQRENILSLKEKVNMLIDSLTFDNCDKKREELIKRAESNKEALKKLFSAKEIAIMGN